ncbi:MAG: aldo/keto reductase [Peptostreptococcaceae bacterium]|jgi:predicted aldo/keto reductase-like oxidoreductase|nr:aldo/keto reductase [Peptostreptococcaceae bacterium]
MLYRELGKNKEKVSILGYGCMRFPIIGDDNSKIDKDEAKKQLRFAIDNGVNYVDTAYPYHDGNSETFVGEALKDGYRKKVKLATKLPSWLIQTQDDMNKYLNEQLKNLQTDYIDYYLLHALNKNYWENYKKNNVFDFIKEALDDGRIKNIGFSFHDDFDLFKEILDSYDWDFCQIQYNFMDENYQAGLKGLNYAKEKNIDLIIMEPLRGGSLTKNIPNEVKKLWDSAKIKKTPAQWGLRYLWNYENIKVVLSGMNDMNHIDENIKEASISHPNTLTKNELEIINKVKNVYNSKIKVNCTDCKYCMPCPFGVNIPLNFSLLNESSMYDDLKVPSMKYKMFLEKEKKASNCKSCGQCEPKCPQNIKIIDKLKEVNNILGQ